MNRIRAASLLLFTAIATPTGIRAAGHTAHEHHQHGTQPSDVTGSRPLELSEIPPLKVLMPEAGDNVGTQLAVVFETPANLQAMTMSAQVIGVHLHVQYDDVSLMPTVQQLVRLGKSRYLYLFDLPVTPGPRTLRVYWSDAQHRTIESTMQEVPVIVGADAVK